MKLWVDDMRRPPLNYAWVRSVDGCKSLCLLNLTDDNKIDIEEINLDHDAGTYVAMGGDYINLLKWFEEKQYLSGWYITPLFKFHTMNPIGRENMIRICKANHWRYEA